MLQKTEQSQAQTEVSKEGNSPIIYTSRDRQMYKKIKQANHHEISVPNDLLKLHGNDISSLSWPNILVVDDEIIILTKDNYYTILQMRTKTNINRHAQMNAELLFVWSSKPANKIIICSVERYNHSRQKQIYLHINLTIFSIIDRKQVCFDIHQPCIKIIQRSQKKSQCKQFYDFVALQCVENYSKIVVLFQVFDEKTGVFLNRYQITLFDIHRKMQLVGHTFIIGNVELSLKQEQKFVKIINSEFGDMILIATNFQVYQFEMNGQNSQGICDLRLKSFKALKLFQQKHFQQQDKRNQLESIKDICYAGNSLKILILTSLNRLFVLQSMHFIFEQQLKNLIIVNSELQSIYKLNNFIYKDMFTMGEQILITIEQQNQENSLKQPISSLLYQEKQDIMISRLLLILKLRSDTLSLVKIIIVPFQKKYCNNIKIIPENNKDSLLVQFIDRRNPKVLEVHRCRTLGSGNHFTMISELLLIHSDKINYKIPPSNAIVELYHPNSQEYQSFKIKSTQFIKVAPLIMAVTDSRLRCFRIMNKTDEKIKTSIQEIYHTNFFEIPLKIVISPITTHFIILFKEFVKFFYFIHQNAINFYTLNLRNVEDIIYSLGGDKIYLAVSGKIYTIDTYSFKETQIIDLYGQQIVQIRPIINEKFAVRLAKKKLIYFITKDNNNDDYNNIFNDMIENNNNNIKNENNQNINNNHIEVQNQIQTKYIKLIQIDLHQKDKYYVDSHHIIIIRNQSKNIQIYKVDINNCIINPKDKQCILELRQDHRHLYNRKLLTGFKEKQQVNCMLLCHQLGFMFLGTNYGEIKQYLWPLSPPNDKNLIECYCKQISSSAIININIDAHYDKIYVIVESGQIIEVQLQQCIDGKMMNNIYLFSEKSRGRQLERRQFTIRQYLMHQYTSTTLQSMLSLQQTLSECEFLTDKIKDDLEQKTTEINTIKIQKIQQFYQINETNKIQQINYFEQIKKDNRNKKKQIQKQIIKIQKQHKENIIKQMQDYEKQLLQIYHIIDNLRNKNKTNKQKLIKIKQELQKQHKLIMLENIKNKKKELKKIQQFYLIIKNKYQLQRNKIKSQEIENNQQIQVMKEFIGKQTQDQLADEEEKKEHLLGSIGLADQNIENYKRRLIQFENIISQTKIQIDQLQIDREQYRRKKKILGQELNEKEKSIQDKEKQLVGYIKNTEQLKALKNTHEFQLNEFEVEVGPIEQKLRQVQVNVQNMNAQIMQAYHCKVGQINTIFINEEKLKQLKQEKQLTFLKRMCSNTQIRRMNEKLLSLYNSSYTPNILQKLHEFISDNQQDNLKFNQDNQKIRKQGQRIILYKNMIRKQIQQQEKKQQHLLKNKNDIYCHHLQNTNLVGQFNSLKKEQKRLQAHINQLTNSIKNLQFELNITKNKRTPSMQIRRISEKKLTPFQIHEEECLHKLGKTAVTKLTRSGESLGFLKKLVKEMNTTESKNDKMIIMRERIKTFVNPELQHRKKVQLFKSIESREKGRSTLLKL